MIVEVENFHKWETKQTVCLLRNLLVFNAFAIIAVILRKFNWVGRLHAAAVALLLEYSQNRSALEYQG